MPVHLFELHPGRDDARRAADGESDARAPVRDQALRGMAVRRRGSTLAAVEDEIALVAIEAELDDAMAVGAMLADFSSERLGITLCCVGDIQTMGERKR
jgi:hypothetical protein